MGAFEVFADLVLKQTVHHRVDDAWDLIDLSGNVAAVLCPRPGEGFVAVSLPPGPKRSEFRRGVRGRTPYNEIVTARVAEAVVAVRQRRSDAPVLALCEGQRFLEQIVALGELSREAGRRLAETLATGS